MLGYHMPSIPLICRLIIYGEIIIFLLPNIMQTGESISASFLCCALYKQGSLSSMGGIFWLKMMI